jgi:pimeloyl-ACP methyl ester carboxylesterase
MIFWLLVLVAVLVWAFPILAERSRKVMNDAARSDAPGHFAELSQGTTHYRWYGGDRAPVAVCVHGLTTPSFVWDAIALRLVRQGFRVLVYDLYGRGYSDRPPGRQNDAFFIRQLEDLLADQTVADDITLFGYSMGGAIASGFAAKHPNRLRQLVLVAPAGFGGFPTGFLQQIRDYPALGDRLAHALFPRRHRAACDALAQKHPHLAEVAQAQADQVTWQGFIPGVLSSLRYVLRDEMEREHRKLFKEEMHVISIWAAADEVIPLAGMGNLTKWNRRAVQVQVEGATHLLPMTHPDAVCRAFADAAD